MKKHRSYDKLDDYRVDKTVYLIKATHNEMHMLWEKYCDLEKRITWVQHNMGRMPTIILYGKRKRPITLSIFWNTINDKIVGFYDPVSELIDNKIVNEYLDFNFPNIPRVDAGNFYNAIHYINKLNEQENK